MASENAETYHRALEAFDRGDRETWIEMHHEDCELFPSRTWPEADVVRGAEANWDFYVKATEPFEQRSYSDDAAFTELDADHILVHQGSDVRGRASGATVELDYWVLIMFREGKVAREEWFLTREEALAAAGADE